MSGTHPTAVYIERPHTYRDRSWTPAFSRRLEVEVSGTTAPHTAVDYSSFHGVGRDITHAMPHMWRYQALAIADKLSIAAQHFSVMKTAGAMFVPGSRIGGMNPVQERTNIASPRSESLTRRATLYPEPTFAPQFAKIM